MTNKFTWKEGDIRITKSSEIARLRAIIADYEARANPTEDDTTQYNEAKRKLASFQIRQED